MAENSLADLGGAFKEAVCIDAGRIYDSCSDKDCLTDLRVLFPEAIQRSVVDVATSAKIKNVTVLNVLIDVSSVPFNKGFYSVDMTYYFEVTAELTTPHSPTCTVKGVAVAEKKAILFGSEGSVRVFSTDSDGMINETNNLPTAKVQVVDPICLSSRLAPACESSCCNVKVPESVCCYFKCSCFGRSSDHTIDSAATQKDLLVTLGLFSIVQLERRVQMLVPVYDFCIPDKDCSCTTPEPSNPCEVFSHIKFPTEQFFPPKLDLGDDCACTCGC